MQSLGRKIVNFLGMTELGPKVKNDSLSVTVALDQGPIPVSTTSFNNGGWINLRGQDTGIVTLGSILESENGSGILSSRVLPEFYRGANLAKEELVPLVAKAGVDLVNTIQSYFLGDNFSTSTNLYIRVPFSKLGYTKLSVFVINGVEPAEAITDISIYGLVSDGNTFTFGTDTNLPIVPLDDIDLSGDNKAAGVGATIEGSFPYILIVVKAEEEGTGGWLSLSIATN